ncbi:MAG TPA: UDP-N-acetyl-D-mannosamine dehydrogenase, partial [Rheinheimera sp.]|nr:UDP-N-acetyl-D-mannosamine dehydrogenase [Rheinheimera sp.]
MHIFSRVSVIGLGYIGLPTAAVIASRGVDVLGVDVSEHAVNTINQGKIHIVEPDLDMLVQAAVTTGKLKASLTPEPAEAFLIAVPTPFKENKSPDLSYIQAALENIAPVISKGNLIVLESTSPVGTTDKISQWLGELRPDLVMPHQDPDKADVYIAHCPERVLPGRVLQELVSNDRIIGGITERCAQKAVALYHLFVRGECLLTNARTAEMAKLTENSFRDVNIAFANELSMICDHLKINVWELIKLANRHPRVNILSPGPGVGGHCIAVDPWFIVDSAPEQAKIIRKAREINDSKPHYVIEKIRQAADQFKKP